MSYAFKIGDRVRIKSASLHPEMVGKEAIIYAKSKMFPGAWLLDVVGVGIRYSSGGLIAGESDSLEPLNPPKSQISEILAMKDLPDFECRKVAA